MKRPATITVFGILNIVFAGLGLLGGCYGLLSPLLLKQTNPEVAKLYTGLFLMVTVGFALLGLASKGLMCASGIGLVRGKAWGRSAGLLWAWCSIGLGLMLTAVNAAYITPQVADAMQLDMQNQTGGSGMPPQMAGGMKGLMLVSALVGGLIAALPYQITFIVMMHRASVTAFFAGQPGPGQPSEPGPAATAHDTWN